MSIYRRALLTGLLATFSAPSWAQSGKNTFDDTRLQPRFKPADQARVALARTTLEAISHAKGRFVQTDHRARQSQGAFYLARPGKIRFEYEAPTSVLIISDGKWVHKWDPRLKTLDKFALDETPLSLFLSRQIRFDKGVIITKVESDVSGFSLTAKDRRKAVEGQILMRFETLGKDLARLKSWVVTDAQGRMTKIELINLEPVKGLSPDLFVMKKRKT